MNVFEDLIEELRHENLLEETVIDLSKPALEKNDPAPPKDHLSDLAVSESGNAGPRHTQVGDRGFETSGDDPESERDFYRKRAIDEVSSLQMVEHIISGIEREHMKMVPATYDDLEAKKALHKFLQVQSDANTTEYAEAEFGLMHETEAWSTALSERDQKISVSNLRRFCENSRPVLSSQALMALGRFYRNAPYSELSRAKFDLVMTRLFSRDAGDEKRRLLFGRSEMIGHIKTLYANWSSVALYSAEDASIRVRAVVAGFEERVAEVEQAQTFEQLIHEAFFNKIHEFKEATGEMFFTPEIVAATIDSNVRIGNKFVDLIQVEREKTNTESVEQKYGYEYDQVISDAAGKTLHLVELLKNLPEVTTDESLPEKAESPQKESKRSRQEKTPLFTWDMFKVNKWLLAATIVVVASSAGLFFWSNQPAPEASSTEMAKDVGLEDTPLKDYLRTGRATSETFYAITLPAWDQLSEQQRKEVLKNALEFANSKGLKYVQLVNVRGRNAAFASDTQIEISNPAP